MRLPFSCALSSDRTTARVSWSNILEHNAELSTVKNCSSPAAVNAKYKSLDGLKDVLMQDSIV